MPVEQREYLKRHVFSISTLAILIGFIVQQSKWQQNVDNRLIQLEKHSVDLNKHMPFEKKIEVFVPRVELNGKLENIDEKLTEIKADLKKSLEK